MMVATWLIMMVKKNGNNDGDTMANECGKKWLILMVKQWVGFKV